MKRVFVLLLACFMVLMLCGCDSSEHIKLTQDESDAIAQYSAYLIMKYDTRKTHTEKLLDEKQLKEVYEERAKEEQENNKVTPTQEPTPTLLSEPAHDVDNKTGQEEVTPSVTVTPEPVPVFETLSECYDNKFKVAFSKYTIGDSFRSDLEYFSLNAPEGQKLVVTEYMITNDSSKDMVYSAADYDVSYILKSDKNTYKPRMSLIANDLLLLEKKLAPGESTSGVLVFFIDEDDTPKSVVVSNPDISPDKIYEITINN
ncbi:MAG: DUF4352 domain-containing protein [Lachnospiraceae bacterium]|nr:DUF4352 domain-containing protein [Lachnospiraceae bacterium]